MPEESYPVDENLCRNCGKCCYNKLIIGGVVFITPFPCQFLDPQTNLCRIYERRHELNRGCLSVPAGLRLSAFPADCPYVAAYAAPGYRPAREDYNWSADWKRFDAWAREVEVTPEVRELVRARGPAAPPMYTEVTKH